MKYTPLRLQVVAAMLAKPDGEWTAREMTKLFPENVHVPAGSVHEAFLLLMNERLAEAVPFQGPLTVRIRTDNAAEALLEQWFAQFAHTPPDVTETDVLPEQVAGHAEGGDCDDQGLLP